MRIPINALVRGLREQSVKTRLFSRTLLLGACCLHVCAALARPLDEMIASHSFSICASDDELPYSGKSPTAPGLYLDIARKISDALGVDLKVDWITSREHIRFTSCDAVMGAAALDDAPGNAEPDTNAIRPRILTIPYMKVSALLVLPSGMAGIESMEDLKRLHVAVPSGSVAHKVLTDSGVPLWVRFRSDAEIIEAVRTGKADAGVVSQAGFGWYRKNNPQTLLAGLDKVLTDPALQFNVAIGIRRTSLDTVKRINGILKQLIDDGTISEILGKYGIEPVAPSPTPMTR
jgi:polar amino acid transport system substrate-binding protein